MLNLNFQLKLQDIEDALSEIRRIKLFPLKFLQSGFWGSVIFSFIAYIVFSPEPDQQLLYKLLALFLIYTVLIIFVYYRYINQLFAASINPQGEPMKIILSLDADKLHFHTPFIKYELPLGYFETVYLTEKFLHLQWSAKKARYLREIAYLSIPRRAFQNYQQQDAFLQMFGAKSVPVKRC